MTVAVNYWRGDEGDAYQARNAITAPNFKARLLLWKKINGYLNPEPESILEVGAGSGQNLLALSLLNQNAKLWAVEPNAAARDALCSLDVAAGPGAVIDAVATDLSAFGTASMDMVFTSGVLIHIPPDDLAKACEEIKRISRRYIVCIEYFAAEPEMKTYRGGADRMWKRDFGKYFVEEIGGVKPLACGFFWKEMTGLDNLTWWVLQKW